jgi:outer membrane protein assembly factor BamC
MAASPETFDVTVSTRFTAVRLACLSLAVGLAACSSVENFMSGEKVDYRSASTTRAQPLDVPPDLSQLNRGVQPQGGTVSAAAYQAGAASGAAATTPAVAPTAIGDVKIVRDGNQRWLAVPVPPEQLWPQLEGFWKDMGFTLAVDQPAAGVMETDWAENRAKLSTDFIRSTLGKVFNSLYDTGMRDKFRTRVERTREGTEIYVSHRGMEEVYADARKDSTVWQPRKPDPQLEADMLQRLMLRLGVKEEQAKAVAAAPVSAPAHARVVEGQPGATLQVDDSFDRAWRRVGLALDRSGFTVEDRDRAQGLYFVRYVDPATSGKDEPGFFTRLFSFGRHKDGDAGPVRYRVAVKGEGDRSTVTVQNSQGQPENGDAGKRIVNLLVEDLK